MLDSSQSVVLKDKQIPYCMISPVILDATSDILPLDLIPAQKPVTKYPLVNLRTGENLVMLIECRFLRNQPGSLERTVII